MDPHGERPRRQTLGRRAPGVLRAARTRRRRRGAARRPGLGRAPAPHRGRLQRPTRTDPRLLRRKPMSTTTTTPVRTLDDIAGDDGIFAIIAMDQRNTLRRMFTAVGIEATDADLRQSKADVARVLSPAASGILFDPTY